MNASERKSGLVFGSQLGCPRDVKSTRQGNAVDLQMARALVEVGNRYNSDESIRCVVLTGSGRLFCAGGDLGLFKAAGEDLSAFLSDLAGTLHLALIQFARMRKPLLVLVNGPAAGAGVGLALAGDIVLVARSAHFTAAYTSIGLTPDGGLTWFLPRLVGYENLRSLF